MAISDAEACIVVGPSACFEGSALRGQSKQPCLAPRSVPSPPHALSVPLCDPIDTQPVQANIRFCSFIAWDPCGSYASIAPTQDPAQGLGEAELMLGGAAVWTVVIATV